MPPDRRQSMVELIANKDRTSAWFLFFGPMAVLLLCNLCLFAFTVYNMFIVKLETSILTARDSNTVNKNKQTLILYVKLFGLMGMSWLTEVLAYAVNEPSYYWFITDTINVLLRAVFIFVIFCCKKSTYNTLRRKILPWFGVTVLPVLEPTRNKPCQTQRSEGSREVPSRMPTRRTSSASFTTNAETIHMKML